MPFIFKPAVQTVNIAVGSRSKKSCYWRAVPNIMVNVLIKNCACVEIFFENSKKKSMIQFTKTLPNT